MAQTQEICSCWNISGDLLGETERPPEREKEEKEELTRVDKYKKYKV